MRHSTQQSTQLILPFKNLAGALLLSVFLGPVGLLYASVTGGITMIILGFIAGCSQLIVPILIIWLGSCIWSVIATNRYNKINLEKLTKLSSLQ